MKIFKIFFRQIFCEFFSAVFFVIFFSPHFLWIFALHFFVLHFCEFLPWIFLPWSLNMAPQGLSQTWHFEWTGKFPSSHWWVMNFSPFSPSIIFFSGIFPTQAHLQLLGALTAQRGCDLNLHTNKKLAHRK